MDYVLSGVVIALMLAISLLGVGVWVPLSRQLFADYHVLADAALALLLYGLLSAAMVRVLLHLMPILPGRYGADSPVFARWKLITVIYRLGQGALNPLIPLFLKPLVDALFGARIGADVAFGGTIDDPYLVTVGAGTVLGNASLVTGNYLDGGDLVCGKVSIGADVTVGANSIVMPDVSIGDGATVMSGACVMPGTAIPPGERWRGNPARKWM